MQTEKLASLGQLTAGIAHEIKNPLNFVNNFSALSAELIDELNDVLKPAALDDKMRAGGRRTHAYAEGQSRKGGAARHARRLPSSRTCCCIRAKDRASTGPPISTRSSRRASIWPITAPARRRPGFNITLQRDLDPEAGMIDLYPQEITRVFLNLISNGFYAASQAQGSRRRSLRTDAERDHQKPRQQC